MTNFEILKKLVSIYKKSKSDEDKQKIKDFLNETGFDVNKEEKSFIFTGILIFFCVFIFLSLLIPIGLAAIITVLVSLIYPFFIIGITDTFDISKEIQSEDLVKKWLYKKD